MTIEKETLFPIDKLKEQNYFSGTGVFFQHFPELIKRIRTKTIGNEKDFIKLQAEASLLFGLQLELIDTLAKADIEKNQKTEILRNFQQSSVYNKYYAAGGIYDALEDYKNRKLASVPSFKIDDEAWKPNVRSSFIRELEIEQASKFSAVLRNLESRQKQVRNRYGQELDLKSCDPENADKCMLAVLKTKPEDMALLCKMFAPEGALEITLSKQKTSAGEIVLRSLAMAFVALCTWVMATLVGKLVVAVAAFMPIIKPIKDYIANYLEVDYNAITNGITNQLSASSQNFVNIVSTYLTDKASQIGIQKDENIMRHSLAEQISQLKIGDDQKAVLDNFKEQLAKIESAGLKEASSEQERKSNSKNTVQDTAAKGQKKFSERYRMSATKITSRKVRSESRTI